MIADGLNLIAFGRRQDDGVLVSVEDVPRGQDCGCVCPSCNLPLVARMGDVNVWHFAHRARNAGTDVAAPCEYSFFVSVRLMAQQIIAAHPVLALPAYRDSFTLGRNRLGLPWRHYFTITEASTIRLTDVRTDTRYAEASVDIVGNVSGWDFVVALSHPGRLVPEALRSLEGFKAGALEIRLNALAERFQDQDRGNEAFAKVVERFLRDDQDSKHWLFHPSYACKRAAALAEAEPKVKAAEAKWRPRKPRWRP
jgi:hypothetical protein